MYIDRRMDTDSWMQCLVFAPEVVDNCKTRISNASKCIYSLMKILYSHQFNCTVHSCMSLMVCLGGIILHVSRLLNVTIMYYVWLH